ATRQRTRGAAPWLSSRGGNGLLEEVLEFAGNFSGDFLEIYENGSIPPILASSGRGRRLRTPIWPSPCKALPLTRPSLRHPLPASRGEGDNGYGANISAPASAAPPSLAPNPPPPPLT